MFFFNLGKKKRQIPHDSEEVEGNNVEEIFEDIISELQDNDIPFTVKIRSINKQSQKEIILKDFSISIISNDTTSSIIAKKCDRTFFISSVDDAIDLIL